MSNKTPLSKNMLLFAVFMLLIATFLSAGCVDVSQSITVRSDGTISNFHAVLTTSSYFESDMRRSVSEEMADPYISEYYTYDFKRSGDKVIVTVRNKKPVPISREEGMRFSSSNGEIRFEDFSLEALALLGGRVEYVLTMPGNIISSNADEVRGNTAVWYSASRIWATSKAPSFPFSALAIFLVICAVAGFFYWRRSGQATPYKTDLSIPDGISDSISDIVSKVKQHDGISDSVSDIVSKVKQYDGISIQGPNLKKDLQFAFSGKEIASQRIAIIDSTEFTDETAERFSRGRREKYQKLLEQSNMKIADTKSKIAEDISAKKFQLESFKNERAQVNTLYQLGEISFEEHERIENGIKKKFDKVKAEATALQQLYEVSRSSEIGGLVPLDIDKDVDAYGNIIKK